ncbi:MAG: hypothetical protein K2Y05_09625 [Hyphomicrobiaceae bacterium]|nr:hypothetical protein [Hyphomicrobiaceae bacterium]
MDERAHSRGAAVDLTELGAAPEGLVFYAAGPVTYRQFQCHGVPWLAVYKAKHDGTGWLVYETTIRPLVLLTGDHVHVRAMVVEDQGDLVILAFNGRKHSSQRGIDRGLIVFLEEAAEQLAAKPAAGTNL